MTPGWHSPPLCTATSTFEVVDTSATVEGVQTSVIEELRLTNFMSFRHAKVQLSELTLIIGRNGSGKSNMLDALEVLSRLSTGDDVRDVLDGGRRDMGPVRGGVEGCAPRGSTEFGRMHRANGKRSGHSRRADPGRAAGTDHERADVRADSQGSAHAARD